MNDFINKLPKAELHVHLVGTLEPEMLMRIAKRNNITLYNSLMQAKEAYANFDSLGSFISAYDIAVSVLKTEEDFFELTCAYLQKAAQQGVLRSEFFFEIQNFEPLGISFATIIQGIISAIAKAKKEYNISAAPILCFIRDYDEKSALHTLEQSLHYKDIIIACGLAGNEQNYPPNKFIKLFEKVREHGYKSCIHAGEDAGPEYIWQAIRGLYADRIDHGVRCIEDPVLMDHLIKTQLPLTVCPLSNKLLNVFSAEKHPLKKLLEAGLKTSIHSDDPAFFGGYITENYAYAHHKIGLTREQLIQCARNSLNSSFADEEEKATMLQRLDRFLSKH